MPQPEPDQTRVNSFTGRQWTILVVLASCNVLSAFVQSLQAPFYPAEAERKGASSTEYGFVFGIYPLVVLVASPVISNLFQKFPPINAFLIGYLTVATSTTLFGFLDKIDDHTTFITLSFALRILEALGGTTVLISNYTFVMSWFPGSIATVFAVLETMFSVGYAAGPAYGGILFQIGGEDFGFTLPFLVTGCLVLITSLIAVWVLPGIKQDVPETSKTGAESNYGFFALLKIPTILIYATAVMVSTLSVGFISSTLESHLRQFMLTPFLVGMVFLIYGAVNAIGASIWGIICDRIRHPEYVTLVGAILMLASFTTVGPLYFLPIDSSVALTGTSLAVFSLGNVAIMVSTFLLFLSEAKKNGFPENPATGAACSGLWLSSLSFGAVIGPSLGGVLLDAYGFRVGTTVITGILIFASILLLGSILARRDKKSSIVIAGEKVSLLSPQNRSVNTLNSAIDKNSLERSSGGYQRI